MRYKPMSNKIVKRFIEEDENEVLYVIQTGFEDTWMVVHEDAFEVKLGTVFTGTKEELEKTYNITI